MFRVIKSAALDQGDQVLPLRQLSPPPAPDETPDPARLLAAARQQAAELVARAEQEAAALLAQAQAEAQSEARQIKAAARQQGWQEGMEAARQEADSIRSQARQVLEQARAIRQRTLDNLEQELVDLAVDIAERLVMTQLAVEPQTIMAVARECMELVKNRPLVNMYVNQADLALVEQERHRLLQGLPGRVELNILADNAVSPGGCRIETDQGQVDATLETRWQEMLKTLYGREE
ncbi:flagellar assembly protein FliH [Desulforamulus hydrothermalis Lam5 = DSM 18033]|nr:flagellar assembly protein FliH [Desulforamulus hydrothermalis Lam5 = DSM 18033]